MARNDYYPFGMQMPGRKYSVANSGYRYGFNGKENDNDVKGEGNQQDYGMRIYDPRLGRFLSEDPITKQYPELTPYQFASNRPIDGIDLDGLEYLSFHSSMYRLFSAESYYSPLTKQIVSSTVVSTVYENIPTKIRNPKTMGTSYQSNVFNNDGTTYKGNVIGGDPDASFYGLATGKSDPEPTGSTKGNAFPETKGRPGTVGKAEQLGGATGALGEEGVGVFINFWNYALPWSEQAAKDKEKDLSAGFSNAVGMTDYYINNNRTNGVPFNRTDIINFLTDGYLRTGAAANTNDVNTKKNIYSAALSTAYAGLQIMQKKNITIRPATVQAVSELLQNYKNNGGGSDFDDISNYNKTTYDE